MVAAVLLWCKSFPRELLKQTVFRDPLPPSLVPAQAPAASSGATAGGWRGPPHGAPCAVWQSPNGETLSREYGTLKTVNARFWPWLLGKSPQKRFKVYQLRSEAGFLNRTPRPVRKQVAAPAPWEREAIWEPQFDHQTPAGDKNTFGEKSTYGEKSGSRGGSNATGPPPDGTRPPPDPTGPPQVGKGPVNPKSCTLNP